MPAAASISWLACSTVHQPGRAQKARQTSQEHGSEGGYLSARLFLHFFGILGMIIPCFCPLGQ